MNINNIYNEDCIDTLKKIDNNSIDLIITDPPYGISYKDNIRKSQYWSEKKKSKSFLLKEQIENDEINNINWNLFLKECFRILKPKKMLYLFGRIDVFLRWGNFILSSDFKYSHTVVWRKGDMGYGNLNIMGNIHEYILGLCKGNPDKSNIIFIEGKEKKRVPAEYVGKLSKKEYYGHPTQKPVGLLRYIIENRTREEDLIYDPFSGSASVALTCKLLKRNYLGSEIDYDFYNLGEKRLQDEEHLKLYNNIINKNFIYKDIKGVSNEKL